MVALRLPDCAACRPSANAPSAIREPCRTINALPLLGRAQFAPNSATSIGTPWASKCALTSGPCAESADTITSTRLLPSQSVTVFSACA